jgi:tRNA 2-thiouridine synthesizing protein A
MQKEAADTVVDCRGQICPMPVFMAKQALAGAQLGQVLEFVVGDDSSKQNVIKYCWNHGQEVLRSYAQGSEFHLFVKKSVEKKPDNPVPAVGPCGTRWE